MDVQSNHSSEDGQKLDGELKKLIQRDKKKIKLLKTALIEERGAREKVEQDLQKAVEKIAFLNKNLQEKEQKYIDLYKENMNIHESFQDYSKASRRSTQLSPPSSNPFVMNNEPSEKVQEYKNKIQELEEEIKLQEFETQSQLKKIEMEKEWVSDQYQQTMEQYEKVQKELEGIKIQHQDQLNMKEDEIQSTYALVGQRDNTIFELTKEIQDFKEQIEQLQNENLKQEERSDQKDQMIEEYRQEILTLKDDLLCKEEVIETLTNTICEKGEEAAKLSEKLVQMKNQMIDQSIFTHKFLITKPSGNLGSLERYLQYIRDTSFKFEFLIQISRYDGSKPKFIPIDIIENIESIDGQKFKIIVESSEYYKINKSKKWKLFSKKQRDDYKSILYQSEYVKEIMEYFDRVKVIILEKEQELQQLETLQNGVNQDLQQS